MSSVDIFVLAVMSVEDRQLGRRVDRLNVCVRLTDSDRFS